MKKRLLYLLLPVITLVLEIIPYGAVCVFASSPTDKTRSLFSYFDLTPYGYANFTPFLTALATCVLLLVLVLFCFSGNIRFAKTARIVSYVAVVLSLGPLSLGAPYYSLVAGLITASLVCEVLLLRSAEKYV
jgi:hypothetical protein